MGNVCDRMVSLASNFPEAFVQPLRGSTENKMSKKFKDKVALITGGTEGIGLATAKLFAKEGAYVFITGRRQKDLDDAVKALGSNVYGVQGDVAKLDDLDRLYETVSKVKGRLDIVFANAGVGEFVPFGAVTEEHFDKLFNINVRGTLFTVQKALPLLKDGGSIILNPHGRISARLRRSAVDSTQPCMPPVPSDGLRNLNEDSYRPSFRFRLCLMHWETDRSHILFRHAVYSRTLDLEPCGPGCIGWFCQRPHRKSSDRLL